MSFAETINEMLRFYFLLFVASVIIAAIWVIIQIWKDKHKKTHDTKTVLTKEDMTMSKAEEKNIGIIKKAKEFLPNGGYSEKELNLAFLMFINGYHQAEKDLELTCDDIEIIVNAFLDYKIESIKSGKTKKYTDEEYCREVLQRFLEMKSHEKE